MRIRISALGFLWLAMTCALHAQVLPKLSKAPGITDTTLSGTAEGRGGKFEQVALYVCTSLKLPPSPPPDCSTENSEDIKQLSLPNRADQTATRFPALQPARYEQDSLRVETGVLSFEPAEAARLRLDAAGGINRSG